MAETKRSFGTGQLAAAVLIALAVGFYGGTVFMELRQPARPQAEQGAGPAPAAEAQQPSAAERARLAELEQAVAARPGDQAAWIELGNASFDAHQARAAITAYTKAVALGPVSPDVWTDLGIMHREAGEQKLALESFEAALKLDPRHEHALYNRGVVLLHDAGDKAGAAAAWQRLLQVNPAAKTPDGRPLKDIVAELGRG